MLLTTTFQDGSSREQTVTALDIVETEDFYEMSIDQLDRFSHLCFLAWRSEHRTKVTGKDFKEWLADVSSVEPVTDPKESTTKL